MAPRKQPIMWEGVQYPSKTALANHLGITPAALTMRLQRGKIAGPPQSSRRHFTYQGKYYDSIAQYARVHGLTYWQAYPYISELIDKGEIE